MNRIHIKKSRIIKKNLKEINLEQEVSKKGVTVSTWMNWLLWTTHYPLAVALINRRIHKADPETFLTGKFPLDYQGTWLYFLWSEDSFYHGTEQDTFQEL